MSSRGTSFGIGARSRKGLVLFWIALFVWSLAMQYVAAATPASVRGWRTRQPTSTSAPTIRAPSPHTDGCATSATEWVNGNLGASKSVYLEGDSIPYRLTSTTSLSRAQHTVTIEWDTTKGGKHALDYLTTFNRTVATRTPAWA